MFLTQEKPEMDDFVRKKLKEKYFSIFQEKILIKGFNGYPCKKLKKYFCIFLCFRTF